VQTLSPAVQHPPSPYFIHNAIRSQNVVFLTEPGNPDLSAPFLCGFGPARQAQSLDMTGRPDNTPFYRLTRHPVAHGDGATEGIGGGGGGRGEDSKKASEIYSLGIVLLGTAL
jgi:hypothetical protein